MEVFADFGLRLAGELVSQNTEQCASDQSQVGQQVGIARTGSVFAHEGIPPPVVANLHTTPMPTDQLQPLFGAALLGGKAGEVVTGFAAAGTGFFDGALSADHDQGSGAGELGLERFDGEGVDGATVDPSMPDSGLWKKGVLFSASSF